MSAQVEMGGDNYDISFSIGIPWVFWLFFHVKGVVPYNWLPRNWPRTTGVSLYGDHLSFSLWADESIWEKGKYNGQWGVFLKDVVLGKMNYHTKAIETREVEIPMPEGNYRADVTIQRAYRRRPRWFTEINICAEINITDERHRIPFPGKGENSWDCGEDGIHSMSCPATTVAEAVVEVVKTVLRCRERYGCDPMWRPECPEEKAACT